MLTLQADNKQLTLNQKYSFLTTNYLSGQSSVVVINSSPFYTVLGDSTTQIDITNPSGTTFRYTYDASGTNPRFASFVFVGMIVIINAQNFNAVNNNTFTVTAVGSNYFEVTNAAGVVESNKTIGTGSIIVLATHVLLGEFGNEKTEIMAISSINTSTHTLTFSLTTKFAHPESTKIIVLGYNQVKFYQTATTTFSQNENPLGTIDIQSKSLFTIFQDFINSTGYGWFLFYNSTNGKATTQSDAIPYTNFGESTVKRVIDRFYALLNNKEQKQISIDDVYDWLNEAQSETYNELNLVSSSYGVSTAYTLTITSGISEYNLPDDFSEVVSIYDGANDSNIDYINISEVPDWDSLTSNDVRYYLRNKKIGITPQPTSDTTYTMRYKTLSAKLDAYDDVVDLPDNMHYNLVNYMLFKASIPLGRKDGWEFYKLFKAKIGEMKLISHKRDNAKDCWDVDMSIVI